jgi:hypothetical protein
MQGGASNQGAWALLQVRFGQYWNDISSDFLKFFLIGSSYAPK